MLLQLVGSKTHPIATDYRGWMDLILHKIIASLKQNSASVSENWLGIDKSGKRKKENIYYLQQLCCYDDN